MEIPNSYSDEIWVNVLGYERIYSVSNYGRIYSHLNGRYRKPVVHKNGYSQVMLSKNKSIKLVLIHRLVMCSFYGKSELEVDHINRIKSDNRLCNLRYCTRQENENNKIRVGKASQYKGVRKLNGKWAGMITKKGKTVHLGTYNTELEAYKSYLNELNKLNLN
jgi:hypothetical protein